MPTYEYKCKKCGHNFDAQQKISDPPLKTCPTCGGEVERMISATSFVLKGSGWYKDGYSSSSSAKNFSTDSKSTNKTKDKK